MKRGCEKFNKKPTRSMMGNISDAEVIAIPKESTCDKACPIAKAPTNIVNTTCKKKFKNLEYCLNVIG